MIIHSFGDSFGDLTFSQAQAEDDWRTSRPPVQSQIGGASGAFDYYDDAAYPTLPTTVVKRYTIVGTSYVNAGTVKEQHKAAFLGVGRSKLWGHLRDGTASAYRRWAWAKCTDFFAVERAGRQFTTYNVEATFNLSEGQWYGETLNEVIRNTTGAFTLTNNGNAPALVNILTIANTTKIERVLVTNTLASVILTLDWDDTGGAGFPAGTSLELNSDSYSVVAAGASNPFSKLSLGSGQVVWMALEPGSNSMNLSITQTGGTFSSRFRFYDTYV